MVIVRPPAAKIDRYRPTNDRRPGSETNRADLPCCRQHGRAQPDRQGGAVRHPRDGPVFWPGAAPALVGSDRIHLPGDRRDRSHGWHARVWEIPVRPCDWAGPVGTRYMFHGFVYLVRTKLV